MKKFNKANEWKRKEHTTQNEQKKKTTTTTNIEINLLEKS